ncbi:hypothetical protein WL42_26080 [Burkholderia ubonensis]|nr:hypothetical protein WL42_26080 [Burkholderia ubonensis]
MGIFVAYRCQQGLPFHVRKIEVGDKHIWSLHTPLLYRVAPGSRGTDHMAAEQSKLLFDQCQTHLIIIDDEHIHWCGIEFFGRYEFWQRGSRAKQIHARCPQ